MNNMRHIMLDIETLGTGPSAAILSIGAVQFDPDQDRLGSEFYARVDLARSENVGTIDPATVEWWLQQSDDARASLLELPRYTLYEALTDLSTWLVTLQGAPCDPEWKLWSNGPTFDETIVRAAFARHGWTFPMHYRASRCMRTYCGLPRTLGFEIPKIENSCKHDALADAKYQARVICAIHQGLRRLSTPATSQP